MADKKEEKKDIVVPKEKSKKDEIVEVSKKDLDAFVARLNTLEADNKKLMQVANKSRLARVEELSSANTPLIRTVRISRFGAEGPIITAWRMNVNESTIVMGRPVENQEVTLTFEDESEKRMPLVDFYRLQDRETKAEVKSTELKDGSEILTVEVVEGPLAGKEIVLDIKYVN